MGVGMGWGGVGWVGGGERKKGRGGGWSGDGMGWGGMGMEWTRGEAGTELKEGRVTPKSPAPKSAATKPQTVHVLYYYCGAWQVMVWCEGK